jgi:hypothetical protein
MAVGVPVAARVSSPALRDLAAASLILPIERGPSGIGTAIARLAGDEALASSLREAGLAFAARHTRAAEAHRLVTALAAWFPDLPWVDAPGETAAG